MGVVYTLKIRWLLGFKAGKDLSAPGAPEVTNADRGAMYSLANVAMPWAMESTRKGVTFYSTFVLFHLGVVAGIALAFLSTVTPDFMRIPVVAWTTGGFIAAAFLIALYRIVRRFFRPVMRLISTPDDYFSLVMLTVWFGVGVITQAHIFGVHGFESVNILVVYLLLTSFFLLMPGRSGLDLLVQLRQSEQWGDIPLVLVTGNDQLLQDDCHSYLGTHAEVRGPDGVLGKPIDRTALLAVVHTLASGQA
jgi:hypothetical protein